MIRLMDDEFLRQFNFSGLYRGRSLDVGAPYCFAHQEPSEHPLIALALHDSTEVQDLYMNMANKGASKRRKLHETAWKLAAATAFGFLADENGHLGIISQSAGIGGTTHAS
jgi:uncharacterized glyoxalase superfamily protein PhnB